MEDRVLSYTEASVLQQVALKRFSLHLAGFMICREDPRPDVDFRESVERCVLDKTGLQVNLAHGEHLSWLEPVVRDKAVDDVVVLADADARSGCILRARYFWL